MDKILNKLIELASRGTCVIGLEYKTSAEPIKNVRIGDMTCREVPYGEAVTSAVFTNNGVDLIRAVDHNDSESIKVFRVDRILSLTVDGQTITA